MNQRLTLEQNYLDAAEKDAIKKGLYDIPVVDADCHYMFTPLKELAVYVEEPMRTRLLHGPGGAAHLMQDLGDRTVAGRLKSVDHFLDRGFNVGATELPKVIHPLMESSQKMAIDYNIIFPTDMLHLGFHPESEIEVAIAKAYAAWMTDKILPHHDSLTTLLYLPFSNPKACLEILKQYGDHKGVVGAMVTSLRETPVHDEQFFPVYKMLEEKGLPLVFHTVTFWLQKPLNQFNKFLSSHAIGFPLNNIIQTTNLIVNGIPERFPDLKFVFVEAGVTWIPFLGLRLDSEYMFRPSEVPLLTKKPSEYMRNFYYTTQPLEYCTDEKFMKSLFDFVDAENQFLYASDYPHMDFDTPSMIYDIPFLSEQAKRKILGENAFKVFPRLGKPRLLAKERTPYYQTNGV